MILFKQSDTIFNPLVVSCLINDKSSYACFYPDNFFQTPAIVIIKHLARRYLPLAV